MWLRVSSEGDGGKTVRVTHERFVIGREADCDLVLSDEQVSRRHAALELRDERSALLQDLGSQNGTFVDGRRIEGPVVLEGGEELRFGRTIVSVSRTERFEKPTVVAPLEERPPAAVVTARDVIRRYGDGETAVHALRGVSVEVARGRLTAIMGPSGSGKSTLMHILAGLDRPTSGSVSIEETNITELGDNELTKLRRNHIGFIFQFFNLLPMLTAEQNILLPLSIAGRKPDPGFLEEMVQRVGLGDRRGHRPAELSGGQQQRVAIARAFVSKPSVVFADEPTGNLDSTTGGEILELMRESVNSYGQTTVMVTHDAHAAAIADRVLFLADGKIVKDLGRSTPHEVLEAMEEVSGR